MIRNKKPSYPWTMRTRIPLSCPSLRRVLQERQPGAAMPTSRTLRLDLQQPRELDRQCHPGEQTMKLRITKRKQQKRPTNDLYRLKEETFALQRVMSLSTFQRLPRSTMETTAVQSSTDKRRLPRMPKTRKNRLFPRMVTTRKRTREFMKVNQSRQLTKTIKDQDQRLTLFTKLTTRTYFRLLPS